MNPEEIPTRDRVFLLVGASVWIALTGALDYLTGVEIRVFPLYFIPICLVGWRLGYGLTLFTAWLSAATWLVSNFEAGLQYSTQTIWVINSLTQALSFSFIGALVVFSRQNYRLAEARSRTDALTGLLNAGAFSAEAGRIAALCGRHGRPVTVVYLDLDDFKQVNDRHGHAQGNMVLATVGRTLLEAGRGTDVVARVGGDEFAMVLAETDEAGAEIMLTRLRGMVAHALSTAPRAVTMSVGAVTSQPPHASIDALLKKADAQLYAAKAAGKDRYSVSAANP